MLCPSRGPIKKKSAIYVEKHIQQEPSKKYPYEYFWQARS